jgi:hypothetical protein
MLGSADAQHSTAHMPTWGPQCNLPHKYSTCGCGHSPCGGATLASNHVILALVHAGCPLPQEVQLEASIWPSVFTLLDRGKPLPSRTCGSKKPCIVLYYIPAVRLLCQSTTSQYLHPRVVSGQGTAVGGAMRKRHPSSQVVASAGGPPTCSTSRQAASTRLCGLC